MGKPYTMREMRSIVEYVNERKAYKETKGRRMWVEFANSRRTDRTWQSLKETFLKRILPDIHNPYYKLTRDQARSFKEGEDVTEKEKKNKLEIRTDKNANGVSRSSDDQNELSTANKDSEMSMRCHENEGQTKCTEESSITNLDQELEKVTGEDNADKIPSCRSSTETLVLEYRNAEDVQRVLESPKETTHTKSKSFKDKLTFEPSTPFSPLAQEILHDFETDSESTDLESKLQIAEDLPKTNTGSEAMVQDALVLNNVEKIPSKNNAKDNEADSTIEIHDTDTSDSVGMKSNKMDTETPEISTDHQTKSDKPHTTKNLKTHERNETNINCNKTLQLNDGITNTESTTATAMAESNSKSSDKNNTDCSNNTIITNTEGSTQNATFDSLLPCNQEALDHKKEEHNAKHDKNGAITVEITRKENGPSIKINKTRKKRESPVGSNEIDATCTVEVHDSPSPTFGTKSLTMNKSINEMRQDSPTTNNTGEKSSVKQLLDNEPNRKAEEDSKKVNNRKDNTEVREENLCLQNVNLFNEQFRKPKYSDSISDDANTQQVQDRDEQKKCSGTSIQTRNEDKTQATDKPKENEDITKENERKIEASKKEVPVLSDDDVAFVEDNQNKEMARSSGSSADCEPQTSSHMDRDKALANVFGFAHGGVPTNRKRRLSHRRRSHHRRRYHSRDTVSHSSEWTSESGSDSYVSPPRGPRSRHTKKFIRPKPSRVLEVPEEGKLYVLFGKRAIYPIVKNGKHNKNFVSYNPDSDSEEEESPWKEKCLIYEKVIKDLTKRLAGPTSERTSEHPLGAQNEPNTRASVSTVPNGNNITKTPEEEHKHEEKKSVVSIKIVDQNGLEHVVEGAWNEIKDAVSDLRKMVHETAEGKEQLNANNGVIQTKADVHVTDASRTSTPANTEDIDVRENVNRKENEIFSVIEKLHEKPETDNANVTKRRGRPRKVQSLQAPMKRTRSSASNSTDSRPGTKAPRASSSLKPMERGEQISPGKIPADGNSIRASSRVLRTPKKFEGDLPPSDVKLRNKLDASLQDVDEEKTLYKFPSAKDKKKLENKNRSLPVINIIPPKDRLGKWLDSTYGYQDSDDTVMKICLPTRKRKASFTARNKHKNRRLTRRKSCPVLVALPSDSDSSYFVPLRRSVSSLNSEHITDSYRLLMPKQNHAPRKLESIDENDNEHRYFRSVSKDTNQHDVGSSSNVSLPLSPELSVVENMSISRDFIKNATHPTINEVQQNEHNQAMDYSEYLISNIDLSVPLMDQRCMLQKNTDEAMSTLNVSKAISQIKDCSVNITVSYDLDRRLHALLLESAKKPNKPDKPTPMETDQTLVTTKKPRTRSQKENKSTDADNPKKNTKTKKRSSTPQKKKTAPKSKAPQDSIIEEEHIEACATGRKSCPPYLTYMPMEEYAQNNNDVPQPVKVNSKNNKDIIKVKITKPKRRSKTRSSENLRGKSVGSVNSASTYSDINDAETLSLTRKDSTVDLIHNHSETCLMARECMDNSVEFIQNSPRSVFSVSSSSHSSQEALALSEDTSSSRDNNASERTSEHVIKSPETKYHSPISNSSLITEDLSDSPMSQPTKWYLLDEDITNMESPSTKQSSYGSNLLQIFPIACAVPNLSTISEASRETEDSRNTGDLLQRLRNL